MRDEAFFAFPDFIAELTNWPRELVDDEMATRQTVESIELTLPVQLDVQTSGDEAGRVGELGITPPLFSVV